MFETVTVSLNKRRVGRDLYFLFCNLATKGAVDSENGYFNAFLAIRKSVSFPSRRTIFRWSHMDESFLLISSNQAYRKDVLAQIQINLGGQTYTAVDFQQVFTIALGLSQLGTFPKRKCHFAHVTIYTCVYYSMIKLHRGL